MDKRKSPKYIQISACIPKDLSILFRMLCANQRLTLNNAIEQSMILWVNAQKEEVQKLAEKHFEQGRILKTEFSESKTIYQKKNSFIKKQEVFV